MDEQRPRFNWDDVERDYKAGLLPLGVVAAKYGLSVANLKKVAAKQGWERQAVDPPPPVVPQGGGVPAMDLLTAAEARGIQAKQVLHVLREHQRDVNKVRGQANILLERLTLFLDGQEITRPFLGGRESPADLLLKVTKVVFSAVRLEREMLGLANYQAPEGENDPDQNEWEELKNEVQNMITTKVGDVHEQ